MRLFSLLAALLLCVGAHCRQRPRIVVVFPTHPPRYPLVLAGRETWRQGVQTLVVTEGSNESAVASPLGDVPFEKWWQFPDDLRPDLHIWKKGDMKAAAAFRIANETFGDAYDWLAYGDDDTVWFPAAAEALVTGLNPSVPYILADVVSSCNFGQHCKRDKVCSLPRNAPTAGAAPPSGCVRSPAVEPCTVAALNASGTCTNIPPPWYGLPFPCGRNGALISRGMMRVMNSSEWRERCELPNTLRGGGELRVYKCLWDAGFAMTDPTPGDDPSFCVMGFMGPEALLATARAVVAANGSCDAACDRDLYRTVSLSVDRAQHASPDFVRELHATVVAAKAAVAARLARALPEAVQSDAAKLAEAMAAAGFVHGAGLLGTLTTGNTQRWRLFVNWLAHAVPLRLPLLVFVSDARTGAACDAALLAARAALDGPPAAPMLCFYPAATLGRFDMVPGADDWKDSFWLRVTNIMKPASLSLAVGAGSDVVFVETDVVLRADVLALLRARPDTATITCMVPKHNASTLPEGNVGVLFFRADARVPQLLQSLLVKCATHWETANDQVELISALVEARDAARNNGTFVVDCVDVSDGFTTGCRTASPEKGVAVHAACVPHTEGKVEWFRKLGLWRHPQELLLAPPSPPPPYPPLNAST